MSEQSPEVFTIDQVGEVLGSIPFDAERKALVLSALQEQATLRSAEAQVPQQQSHLEEQ